MILHQVIHHRLTDLVGGGAVEGVDGGGVGEPSAREKYQTPCMDVSAC